MKRSREFSIANIFWVLLILFTCTQEQPTIKSVMDSIVSRFYKTMDSSTLFSLDDQKILQLISEKEKTVFATKYWSFEVNVPAIVSIMRHVDQPVKPFWLNEKNGFTKTQLFVKNEQYTYEVWQKYFPAGKVELGINGFDKHRPVYFVSVAAQNQNDELRLFNFYPKNQHVSLMDVGLFTYIDWDELVLTQVPDELKGQKLLTTIRGRAREAHLVHAFRTTAFPSSAEPDQILLTWSDNPQTTQTIQWRTSVEVTDGAVLYQPKNANPDQHLQETKAQLQLLEDRLLQNDRFIHRFTAKLQNLSPATTYIYQVGSHQKNKWSSQAEFTTAPDSSQPFSFVYFGDSHCSPYWGKLINSAQARFSNTAFYTIAGDVVSTGLNRDDWDQLFAYGAEVFKYKPLMPALGNHDDQDGLGAQMYLDFFALPENGPPELEKERAYSFTYSNAFFIILDVTSAYAKQVDWLEQQLAHSQATWKFAVFHFPPYMHEIDYRDIRKLWGDVFDLYHLDMAFSGHVHYYVRSKPMYQGQAVASPAEGTIYVTSVAIPASDEEKPDERYTEVHFGGGMIYQQISIEGNCLTYQVFDIDGHVRDELVIKKENTGSLTLQQ